LPDTIGLLERDPGHPSGLSAREENYVAIDSSLPQTRRSILGAALGGVGVLIAHALGKASPVVAANDDPLLLGRGTVATDNAATASTIVNSTAVTALGAISATGTGLYGRSTGPGSSRSTGVIGATGDPIGVAPDTDETGVYGFSDDSVSAAGVWGDSISGTGVVGSGDWGVFGTGAVGVVGSGDGAGNGVHGFSGDSTINVPPAGTGVHGYAGTGAAYGVYASAASTSQTALYVGGQVRLSSSGRVSIGATSASRFITMAGVTTSSYIVATLQTVPYTYNPPCFIRAVVPTTGGFTIYLSRTAGKTVVVGYVVIN